MLTHDMMAVFNKAEHLQKSNGGAQILKGKSVSIALVYAFCYDFSGAKFRIGWNIKP